MENGVKRGRKPKDLPAAEKERRNLEAQRAFRQRKIDQHAALEAKVAQLQAIIDARPPLPSEHESLRHRLLAAEAEISVFRQSGIAIDFKASFPAIPTVSAPVSGHNCLGCKAEKTHTLVALGQVQMLSTQISELQMENQMLRSLLGFGTSSHSLALLNSVPLGFPENSNAGTSFATFPFDFGLQTSNVIENTEGNNNHSLNPPTSSIDNTGETIQKSGIELYGQPEIQFARIGLKSIPTLKDCKYVDIFFDVMMGQLSSKSKLKIQKLKIKAVATRAKILESCDVTDRQKVLFLMWIILARNPDHARFLRTTIDSMTLILQRPRITAAERTKRLQQLDVEHNGKVITIRNAFLSIPPLQNEHEIIEEFCLLLWMKASESSREDRFVGISIFYKRLHEKCCINLEHSVKFGLIIDSFREENPDFNDDLFDEAEFD
ncbi:hypothetical protein HK100_005509 [Physocladia obscura]|uniref:BZIP domain-containing protein n=1 Tax=Physocladia obscura TaxID=109957 RepID=A0AAD5X822_9FUNG|nr:hypothetical protein HK100_005509 [Physocladia obscura]